MNAALQLAPRPSTRAPARDFDGIVCFGGVDWWYHNRGHFDLQLMRELSARVPVLYVNSIGMRAPSPGEGALFLRRVARKLRSLARGTVRVRPGFAVTSPCAPPAARGGLATELAAHHVRRAARRLGMRRPLAWVACPPALRLLPALDPAGLVFQRTDRFEAFHGVDAAAIGADVAQLLRRADLALYCSQELLEQERRSAPGALYVDHGVDLGRFVRAGDGERSEPVELRGLPRPRVGFVGGLDAHTFDPALFREVARRVPEASFVLVGGRTLAESELAGPNVHLMGRRSYEDVPAWMAACDVLIMPWNRSEWIRACNPVKLKEYLAVGRPVVSTPFAELRRYAGLVQVAADAAGFAAAVRHALSAPHDPRPGRARVAEHGWDRKAGDVLAALAARGLRPVAVSAA